MGAAHVAPGPNRRHAMKRIISYAVALLIASAVPAMAVDIQIFNHPASGTNAWKLTDTTVDKYNSSGTSVWGVDSSGNVTTTGGLTASGDLSAPGGFKMMLAFAHEDVGLSLSSHALIAGTTSSASDTDNIYEWQAP